MANFLDVQRLRAQQPGPAAPARGQDLLRPKVEYSTLESLYGGATFSNFMVEGYEQARKARAETTEPDPNWNPARFLRENPEHQWILDLTREDEDAYDTIVGTRNEGEMLAILENQKRVMDQAAAFAENPVAGWTGAIGGAVLDLPSLIPGIGVLNVVTKAAKSIKAARAIGAARLAAVAATENAGFELLRRNRDITSGASDLAIQAGLGAVFGAGIGAGIPRLAGVTLDPRIAEGIAARRVASERPAGFDRAAARSAADERQKTTLERRGAGGSATVDLELPYGGGSLGRGFLPFGDALRSIKQRWKNHVVDLGSDPNVKNFYREFSKMARDEAVTVGERSGVTVRPDLNWEENTRKYLGSEYLGGLHANWQISYQKLADDLADGFMAKAHRDPVFSERFDFVRRYRKPGLSKGEFLKLMWWWAQHEGRGLDSEKPLKRFLPNDISQAEFARVRDAVKEAALQTDETMQKSWKQWHKLGLVEEPEPPIAYYWAQLWKREDIAADEKSATEFLTYNMGFDPPEPWLVEQGFLQPGEFWRSLPEDKKILARDEWAFTRAEAIRAEAEEILGRARKKLGAAEEEAEAAAFARHDARLAELQEQIAEQEEIVANGKTKGARFKAAEKLQKLEDEAEDIVARVEEARVNMQTREGMLRELEYAKRRAADRTERERIAKAQEKLVKTQEQVEKAEVRAQTGPTESQVDPEALARGMIRHINSTLTDQENIYGFALADYNIGKAGQSPNLHPRTIDVTRSIADFDERLGQFMETDPERIVESYFRHMAPRAALQETFGTQDLEAHFRNLIDQLPAHLRHDASEDIKAMLDRGLGRHLARDPDARWWSSFLRQVNVPTFLGRGILSQSADTGLLHQALGSKQMGKTMQQTVKQLFGRDKTVLKALQKLNRPTLMALIVGMEQAAGMGGRARRLLEIDPVVAKRGLGRPGTAWYHLTRNLFNASQIGSEAFMEVNLMNHWNRTQTRGLRKAAIMQLVTQKWDDFPTNYQATMRSRGVGPEDMKRFKELYDQHQVEVAPGLVMPDIDRWPAAARRKFERAVETASGVGIIMPGLGDMPRWANSPIGALFFQFTGFAYSAQNKFLRRIAQDPTAASNVQALFMALFFTTMANGARAVLAGREDEWVESWQTPEGVSQNMYDMFVRGPFAVAWTSSAAELITSQLSRPVNQGLSAIGLPELAPHVSRFAERQGLARTLGPAWAQAERTAETIRTGAAAATGGDKEWDQFTTALRRNVPGAGLFQLDLVERALGD